MILQGIAMFIQKPFGDGEVGGFIQENNTPQRSRLGQRLKNFHRFDVAERRSLQISERGFDSFRICHFK